MPVLIAMSFQTLYALVNLFFVGRLGAKAVAGVSVSLTAFFVVLTLAQSLGVGGLALISQAWGKKEFNQGREIFTQILWVALFIGFISWILGFFGAAKYISFFTQDPETFTQGFAYFRLYSMTFFLQLFMMSTSFCFRGSGDFMTPMRMMLLSVFMNILLDPILIYGLLGVPALGVRGAALASIISQSTTCLVYGYWIVSRRLNLYVTSKWQPDWQEIKKIPTNFRLALGSLLASSPM
jgi:putative MATE family efflux protein